MSACRPCRPRSPQQVPLSSVCCEAVCSFVTAQDEMHAVWCETRTLAEDPRVFRVAAPWRNRLSPCELPPNSKHVRTMPLAMPVPVRCTLIRTNGKTGVVSLLTIKPFDTARSLATPKGFVLTFLVALQQPLTSNTETLATRPRDLLIVAVCTFRSAKGVLSCLFPFTWSDLCVVFSKPNPTSRTHHSITLSPNRFLNHPVP